MAVSQHWAGVTCIRRPGASRPIVTIVTVADLRGRSRHPHNESSLDLFQAVPIFLDSVTPLCYGPRKLKDRHLKMTFRQDGRIFRAVAWNSAEREGLLAANRGAVDLAFSLEKNEFNGATYVELRVEDFRAPVAP